MKNKLMLILLVFVPFYMFSQTNTKFILLEEFSTAPCGFCPDGDVVAMQMVAKYPNLIWVTHHAGFGTDSMTAPESKTLAGKFTTFAPGACIDRINAPIPVYTKPNYIAISRQKWDSVIGAHYGDTAYANIGIQNDFDSNTGILNCKVSAYFNFAPAPGDIRFNIFIIEDSVVGYGKGYDQTNYYNSTVGHPCYNKGDPIVGYVHHRVVRKVPGGAWGVEGIIPNSPTAGSLYEYNFSNVLIPGNWKKNDIDVVAFISYYHDSVKFRRVINSNHKKMMDFSAGTENDPGYKTSYTLYPNPAGKQVFVSGIQNSGKPVSYTLTDMTGRIIKTGFLDSLANLIEINGLTKGIYLIHFMDSGQKNTQKLLVE